MKGVKTKQLSLAGWMSVIREKAACEDVGLFVAALIC